MSQQVVLRSLRHWVLHFHNHHRTSPNVAALLYHHQIPLLTSSSSSTLTQPTNTRDFSLASSPRGNLRRANVPLPNTTTTQFNEDEEDPNFKSRNQLKREAKRAVKWGMDLSNFSPPQIKRILRVVSLDQIVYEALMLVKRMGSDVREGRRRQFNYIGKLLRDVEPELMDRLIKATRDSDHKELQALTGLGSDDSVDDDDNLTETEDEEEDEVDDNQVTRWFDGLVEKDIQITNEVYSVQGVEFDRQELRKLVRKVHFVQEMKAANEEEEKKIEKAEIRAKKALTRFLRSLSKNISSIEY
ncbi:uncharacterized protein [Cicer arietinum]|uniref:Uncharacterized protein LOC101495543 n=1 Tax=Cicer arietinum TaxID=3827 RepID=A0A1S2Y011_CICAR|nr:uncharacterized protein LOC101495543 [Cicer arietinum]